MQTWGGDVIRVVAWLVLLASPSLSGGLAEPKEVVIASGVLTAAAHEEEDGYYAVGQGLAIMIRPQTVYHQQLQELKKGGSPVVEVRIRVIE